MKQEFIRVGRIVNAHGIRGEVRVQPRRVCPRIFSPVRHLLYGWPAGQPPTANHVHKELVLLKFPGVDDMNAALNLKGKDLFLRRADIVPRRHSILTTSCWGWRSTMLTAAPVWENWWRVDEYPAQPGLHRQGRPGDSDPRRERRFYPIRGFGRGIEWRSTLEGV